MSNWAVAAIAFAALVIGGALGWQGRGWYDGSNTTAGAAAEQAQTAVDSGIEATRKIDAAATATETAVERVRYVTRTVQVAADCPPGAGPVSADIEQQLRDLAKARQSRAANAGARDGRVPE